MLLALVAVAMAVTLRFGHGLTVDEPYTANTARLSWRGLSAQLPNDNVPFFYVVMRIWIRIFGDGEVALRAVSALSYGGAVILTGLAARRAAGTSGGLVAATLMVASDRIGLEHAATARPYAMLSLIAAAVLLLSIRALDGSIRGRAAGVWLTLLHLLGMFTHPVYIVMAASCAAASLAIERRVHSAVLLAPVIAVVAYFAAWGPIVRQTIALQTTSWMKPPTAADVQRAFMLLWGTGPAFVLTGAIVAVVSANVPRAKAAVSHALVRWICLAAAFGWILPVVVSMAKPIFEPTRTPMLLLPLTCVAVATLLVRCGGRAPAIAFAVIAVAAAVPRVAAMPRVDPYPSRASLAALTSRTQCGDTLIATGLAPNVVGYYLSRQPRPPCVTVAPFPASMVNWTGQLREPDLHARLESEAAQVARGAAAGGHTAWLLRLSRGETQEASAMMESALRRVMACADPEPLKGAFFDSVVRCDAIRRP